MGEGNCESKIAARRSGVNSGHEASRCLARPSGKLSCSQDDRKEGFPKDPSVLKLVL